MSQGELSAELEESNRLFIERFNSFVFFHLGSDAVVGTRELPDGIEVEVEHSRVQPFRFELTKARMAKLLNDPDQFEEFFLGFLTTYRRS